LLPVRVEWHRQRLCTDHYVRVNRPALRSAPHALSDAVNLLSAQRIESGLIKATNRGAENMDTFHATVAGLPVREVETFRTDPLTQRWEGNFRVPRLPSAAMCSRSLLANGCSPEWDSADFDRKPACAADTPENSLRKLLKRKPAPSRCLRGRLRCLAKFCFLPMPTTSISAGPEPQSSG